MVDRSNVPLERTDNTAFTSNREETRDQFTTTAPIWSALAQQQLQEFLHSYSVILMDTQWRKPGVSKNVDARRNSMELLAYGILSALPSYAQVLPAIRYDIPFTNKTQLQTAMVDGLVDSTMDLYQCDGNQTNGYFDVCYGDGPKWVKENCWKKDLHGGYSRDNRLRKYPNEPGHERWSCNDAHIMQQLLMATILDYLMYHNDRIYKHSPTKNLFFFKDTRPVSFVSIDHHPSVYNFFKTKASFERTVQHRRLLEFDLPPSLRKDLETFIGETSKDDFVKNFNATIRGQLDNLNSVLAAALTEAIDKGKLKTISPASVTDVLWFRLHSVASFYNITNDKE